MPRILSLLVSHEPEGMKRPVTRDEGYELINGEFYMKKKVVASVRAALHDVDGCCLDNKEERERVLYAVLEALGE